MRPMALLLGKNWSTSQFRSLIWLSVCFCHLLKYFITKCVVSIRGGSGFSVGGQNLAGIGGGCYSFSFYGIVSEVNDVTRIYMVFAHLS